MGLRDWLTEAFRDEPAPTGGPTLALALRENQQLEDSLELMQERLAELELAIEDEGWQRLTGDGERELSRDGLRRIARMSRLSFLKNPLINRAVTLQAMYVWGQGVNIEARHPDVDAVVQSFLDDPKNQAELTSHQARVLKEIDLQVDGNVFFVLFPDPADGKVRVRSIPPDEVVDIITNPDDAKDVWYYKRTWNLRSFDPTAGVTALQSQTAYYPDWRYSPTASKPQTIGQSPVQWETPVYHVKVGGMSDMRFGVPETYAALDWARAYKSFLEDWATITRALSRFAWNLTAKGGARGVAAAKTKLGTTLATGGSAQSTETNPPPVTGSTFISAEGVKLDPVRTSGATTSAEDGRRMLLMVAAATGLPESFFGDVSVGTLATAKSLDRPTELKFRDRQTLWADVLNDIFQFVIDWAARSPGGALNTGDQVDPAALHVQLQDDPQTGEPIDRYVAIDFPAILEHDVDATVGAIVNAATLAGHPSANTIDPKLLTKLLLTALGQDDIDELLDQMYPEDDPGDGDQEQTTAPAEDPGLALAASVRKLTEAVLAGRAG